MSSQQRPLLGLDIPADCNAKKEAQGIVDQLENVTKNGDAAAFADLFLEYGMGLPTRRIGISQTDFV